ncbi:MAG: CD225/dispanin family protein [Lutibacter sp.]
MNQHPPKNYLIESILVTIFCCLPFGIAGIVFAAQVNAKFEMGDYEGAKKASEEAQKWMTWESFPVLSLDCFIL